MSCPRFRHVLALLDDDEAGMWAVLDRAIELADAEQARLTLAKTTNPGWIVTWFGPLALLARIAPPADCDIEEIAGHVLARAAEFVPSWIPLTTMLLRRNTAAELARLDAGGTFDLLVARRGLILRGRTLRRAIRRLDCCTLAVSPEPVTEADLLARDPDRVGRITRA